MHYYKIKPQFDNKIVLNSKIKFLISNEIFTLKEIDNNFDKETAQAIRLFYSDKVDINKNDTYFSFGARFIKNNK